MQVTPVVERLLHIRLEHTCVFMTVGAVYALPRAKTPKARDEFYHKLDSAVGRCPTGDVLVMLRLAEIGQETNRVSVPTVWSLE